MGRVLAAPRIDLPALAAVATARYPLDPAGLHGPEHWARVRTNGLRIARHSGASPVLVEAFALLHDCCRESEGTDREHGPRAAAFARSLRGGILEIGDEEFARLEEAIRDHDRGRCSDDPLVGTCWDADRLDLGRVGVRPLPHLLSTEHARLPETILWAFERSMSWWGDERS